VCVAAQFTRWVKVPLNFRLGSSYPNLGVTSQGLIHKYQRAGRLPCCALKAHELQVT